MNLFLLSTLIGAAAVSPAARPHAVTIPFELVNRTIFLRTEVRAHTFWFVLDSGAGTSVMDLAAARTAGIELGDSVSVVGVGRDTVTARIIPNGGAHVAGLEGADQPLAMALPLDPLANASGHDFAGVLGSDFIWRHVLTIDYARHRLTVCDTAGYSYRGRGAALPITFGAFGFPLVMARVMDGAGPAREGSFVLDIGSGATLILHRPFVEDGGLLADRRPTVPWIEGQGLGGGVDGVVGRVTGLAIGPWTIRRPVTVFSRAASGPLASESTQGNIGAGILDKFRVIIDYARRRVILEPGRHFGAPTEYDRSGLLLTSSGAGHHDVRVAAVSEGSPAAEAGLRPGDRLIAIDGHAAGATTLWGLRLEIQNARRCALAVEREGRRMMCTLIPRRRV